MRIRKKFIAEKDKYIYTYYILGKHGFINYNINFNANKKFIMELTNYGKLHLDVFSKGIILNITKNNYKYSFCFNGIKYNEDDFQ